MVGGEGWKYKMHRVGEGSLQQIITTTTSPSSKFTNLIKMKLSAFFITLAMAATFALARV